MFAGANGRNCGRAVDAVGYAMLWSCGPTHLLYMTINNATNGETACHLGKRGLKAMGPPEPADH